MLWNLLMYFFYFIGIIVALGIIFVVLCNIFEWIGNFFKSIWKGTKDLFNKSKKPKLKKALVYNARIEYKNQEYEHYKHPSIKIIPDFYEFLQQKHPDLFYLFVDDDRYNNYIEQLERTEKPKSFVRVGGWKFDWNICIKADPKYVWVRKEI